LRLRALIADRAHDAYGLVDTIESTSGPVVISLRATQIALLQCKCHLYRRHNKFGRSRPAFVQIA